jgi:hypothetical protein
MKLVKLIAVTALSMTAPFGLAQPPDQPPQPQGMPVMGGQGTGSRMMAGAGQKPMMQRLQALRADVDEILSTEDPAKRQELLEAHRNKLDEAIARVGTRQGGQGKQHGMRGGHGKHHGMKGGQGKRRHHDDGFHQRVEKRLELIQTLVEQVLENQIDR